LVAAAVGDTPLLGAAAMKGHHDIPLLAAAQRVMHEVAVRTGPDARRIPLEVRREVAVVGDGAVHHLARYADRIADQLLADRRLHAVARDQRRSGVALA